MLLSQIKYKLLSSAANLIRQNVNNNTFATAELQAGAAGRGQRKKLKQQQKTEKTLSNAFKNMATRKRCKTYPVPLPLPLSLLLS